MKNSLIETYMDLNVWIFSHEFVLEIYKITKKYPDDEKFGLTNQLRRAASSVPANIAEGNGKQTTRLYIQSLYISKAELNEARYFLLLSKDLEYIDENKYDDLIKSLEQISKMLVGLIRSLKRKIENKNEKK
jgi:four helix bundle protein